MKKSASKITISIDEMLLKKLDHFVKNKTFKTRSHAIQTAVKHTIDRMEHKRLAKECAKLNSAEEQAMADEGLETDLKEWPEF